MAKITRKSIRISSITESLLKKLRPELADHGAGYIVDVIAHEQSGLPAPMAPDVRRQKGAAKRGKKLKGKPALNPSGRKPKEPRSA
jgi:hypothetical protein